MTLVSARSAALRSGASQYGTNPSTSSGASGAAKSFAGTVGAATGREDSRGIFTATRASAARAAEASCASRRFVARMAFCSAIWEGVRLGTAGRNTPEATAATSATPRRTTSPAAIRAG